MTGKNIWRLCKVYGRMIGIDTTQIYASIRPPQLKRAVSFYEEQATRMLSNNNGTRTSISVANGRTQPVFVSRADLTLPRGRRSINPG